MWKSMKISVAIKNTGDIFMRFICYHHKVEEQFFSCTVLAQPSQEQNSYFDRERHIFSYSNERTRNIVICIGYGRKELSQRWGEANARGGCPRASHWNRRNMQILVPARVPTRRTPESSRTHASRRIFHVAWLKNATIAWLTDHVLVYRAPSVVLL